MRVPRQGFALIIVLIAVAALFAVAMQATVAMRTTTMEVGAIERADENARLARSAATLALAGHFTVDTESLAGDQNASGDGSGSDGSDDERDPEVELPEAIRAMMPPEFLRELEEARKKDDEASEDLTGGAGGLSSQAPNASVMEVLHVRGLPQKPVTVEVEGVDWRISFADFFGRLNVNKADDGRLRRYFLACGFDARLAESLTDQILDWRDEDDFVRPRGAERDAHARNGVTPRNGTIRALEELLYLPAMTPRVFERVRGDLALAGESVHAGSASREVLMSLPGMTAPAAEAIIEMRRDGALTRETLAAAMPLGAGDAESLVRLAASNFILMRIDRLDDDGRPTMTFEGRAVFSERGIVGLGVVRRPGDERS